MEEWLFQQRDIKTTLKTVMFWLPVLFLLVIPDHVFPANIWRIFAISGHFSALCQNQVVSFLQQHAKTNLLAQLKSD